jgi:lipopolysaccharide export LptBFGC system permease protein LptF
VPLIHRYLARRFLLALLVAAPAASLLVLLLQAMRILPLIALAGAGVSEILEVLALVSIPLLSLTLPAATIIAQQMVLARLERDGELLALSAAGVGPLRLALAPAALALIVALIAGMLTIFAEPAAFRGLQSRMSDLMVRSLLGQIHPGVLVEPTPELTFLAQGRGRGQLSQVFIDDRRRRPSAQLYAARAKLTPLSNRAAVRLLLEEGLVKTRDERERVIQARFERLEITIALSGAAGELEALFPARLTATAWELAELGAEERSDEAPAALLLLHRRLGLGPGTLGLCLLTLCLALISPFGRRPWAIALGAALLLGFHLMTRLGEALVVEHRLDPFVGGWLPSMTIWAALTLVMAARLRRRTE